MSLNPLYSGLVKSPSSSPLVLSDEDDSENELEGGLCCLSSDG